MSNGIAALKRVVKVLGTQAKVAEAVGIRQQSVSEIIREGRRVPAEWVLPLEQATVAAGTKITRHELRPDLYPMDITPIRDASASLKPKKRAA